jgi:hypothetical protein
LPWMLKVMVEEVALMPAIVPLSKRAPLPTVEGEVQKATLPIVPPLRPEPEAEMLICPGVVVTIVTLEPATRVVGAYLVPVPSAARSWPVWVGAVVTLEPATRVVGAYLVPVPSAASSWPVTVGAVEVPVPPLVTELS